MCGRYSLENTDKNRLPESLRWIPAFEPRYNIAPQQKAPIIRVIDGKPICEELTWGFRPSWMKDRNKAQINARGETLFAKPMFKHSAVNKRCLVLANGWYEWQKLGSKKQPYRFHLTSDELFAFAGIWTQSDSEAGEVDDTYAIITTEASRLAASIHNRMPVILSETGCQTWLDMENKDAVRLNKLLAPYQGKDLDTYPISTYVNNPKNTDKRCLEPMKSDVNHKIEALDRFGSKQD